MQAIRAAEVQAIFRTLQNMLIALKDKILSKVPATIGDVKTKDGQEGLVVSDGNLTIKLVNRYGFSRKNFLTSKFRKK